MLLRHSLTSMRRTSIPMSLKVDSFDLSSSTFHCHRPPSTVIVRLPLSSSAKADDPVPTAPCVCLKCRRLLDAPPFAEHDKLVQRQMLEEYANGVFMLSFDR